MHEFPVRLHQREACDNKHEIGLKEERNSAHLHVIPVHGVNHNFPIKSFKASRSRSRHP